VLDGAGGDPQDGVTRQVNDTDAAAPALFLAETG
jgi:hypothetical protein